MILPYKMCHLSQNANLNMSFNVKLLLLCTLELIEIRRLELERNAKTISSWPLISQMRKLRPREFAQGYTTDLPRVTQPVT